MPQETKSKFTPNPPRAPHPDPDSTGDAHPTLQGLAVTSEDRQALLAALENAFDYRGDITIIHADGSRLEGYIFDRVAGATLSESFVRLLTPDSDAKITVAFSDIARLEFTGRDTAAGKTFENWIKRYIEKKRAGEKASIESERLE